MRLRTWRSATSWPSSSSWPSSAASPSSSLPRRSFTTGVTAKSLSPKTVWSIFSHRFLRSNPDQYINQNTALITTECKSHIFATLYWQHRHFIHSCHPAITALSPSSSSPWRSFTTSITTKSLLHRTKLPIFSHRFLRSNPDQYINQNTALITTEYKSHIYAKLYWQHRHFIHPCHPAIKALSPSSYLPRRSFTAGITTESLSHKTEWPIYNHRFSVE